MLDRLLRAPARGRMGVAPALLVGVVTALAAAGLRLALEPFLKDEAAFTPNFLALFAAAYLGGWLGGLSSMIVAGGLTYYFFFDPAMAWRRPPQDVLSLLLFWAVSGLILLSVVALRRALSQLMAREQALLLAREQEELLSREMAHRIKNMLTIIQSLVDQTLRSATDVDDSRERLHDRLDALTAAQELALNPVDHVRLGKVVEAALAALGDERIRFDLRTEAEIPAAAARGMVLALHELATNARKYGALTRPGGEVRIATDRDGPGMVRLSWIEAGGPSVREPQRRGFGSRLITGALAASGGRVELAFLPDGVSCIFHVPTAGAAIAQGA